ncbi:MAG: acylphosphatase [Actinobacteria bacterium]|nr:acylphosphatase [Actinomycetota bacterium]
MSQKKIETYNLLLSGRVQGVGFRYFAQYRAVRYNIKGYVRNTYDDKVEIVCQGEPDILSKFIREVKNGPSFSQVSQVEMEEIKDPPIYDSFEIKY